MSHRAITIEDGGLIRVKMFMRPDVLVKVIDTNHFFNEEWGIVDKNLMRLVNTVHMMIVQEENNDAKT